MASIFHAADSADPLLQVRGAPGKGSVLDRIDNPRAVFALLGGAALIGLSLAFVVARGLEHVGRGAASPHRAAATAQEAPDKEPPNPELARTLAPRLQYQEMTSPSTNAAVVASAPEAQAAFKLTAPALAPIARAGRPTLALAAPPRIEPTTRVEVTPRLEVSAPSTAIARMEPAPALNAAPRGGPADAERRVAVVLDAAARSEGRDQSVIDAATDVRRGDVVRGNEGDPPMARRLNEEANRAYWINHDLAQALQLERRAYQANPNDVEIAGNLAFYYLKQTPPHPEAAREVALRALTAHSPRYRTGRLEDWMSLGIASALLGRTQEAEHAFLAGAALGNNLDRTCRAAVNAVATYGEAVRPAAGALLRRISEQGRSDASPYCAWPPDWSLGRRMP